MNFRPRASIVTLSIVCCCLLNAAVGDDVISTETPQLAQWIQQLGDESFEVRETATRQLSTQGLAAKRELLLGMRDTDPEIRWCCTKLWADLHDTDFQLRAEAFLSDPVGIDNYEFQDWDRYRKLFGTSCVARQTFLNPQKEEPSLWEESATDEASTLEVSVCAVGSFVPSCRTISAS